MRNVLPTASQNSVYYLSQLHEYALIAQPSKDILTQLVKEMQLFSNNYYSATEIFAQPYIVITGFRANEEAEDTFIRWMHRIVSGQNSFEVTLNNFSGIPPHSIHVRVQNTQAFEQITDKLQVMEQFICASYDSPQPAMLPIQPYIPIAGRLPQHIYDNAMFDYAQRDFHASFMLNELSLLKRWDNFEQYKQVSVFRMQPLRE